MLDFYYEHKSKLEQEIKKLYGMLFNAGIESVGGYKNRIIIVEEQLAEINNKIAEAIRKQEVAEPPMLKEPEPRFGVRKQAFEPETKSQGQRIKIFLASSAQLKEERDQFEIFINRENKRLFDEQVFIELVIWEDFIDAIAPTRLQEEYNKAIRASDIFISLFETKVGKYTKEEFQVALEQFKETGKPLIYTYFKNTDINKVDDPKVVGLLEFKNELTQMGHFTTSFSNIYDLKYQFKMQLDKILPALLKPQQ